VSISKAMNKALNAQVGDELQASNQYLAIAGYFEADDLPLLAGFFFKQSSEEREHGLKMVKYILEAGGKLEVPAIAAPKNSFASAEEAIKLAVDWEKGVTKKIHALVDRAIKENDHATREFLGWFVSEQVEEEGTMNRMLHQVRRSGGNVLLVEAYMVHTK
jgi:bacterioferritin B